MGGLGEIGKNMTLIRYNNEILVIDAGLSFPDEEMLGIDLVVPDYSYLLEQREMVAGILITHGHEDHIGALSYLLKDLMVPVYGTKLTIGIIRAKLEEANVKNASLNIVNPGDILKLGSWKVEFINDNHSIPGSVGLGIHTPLGTVIHTGDFKLDFTPVSGEILDLHKYSELGNKGVLCLLSDSTNVERPGFTKSERTVGDNIDRAFFHARGRIIFATFASNVHRLQQAITSAVKYGRQIAVIGRSMENIITIAAELGYLDIPAGSLIEVERIADYRDSEICILTTGSQGEPMSALSRIAKGDHRQIAINPGDTVVISASPIPGNEKAISRNIDLLLKLGAVVIYDSLSGMHVSGHASEEELKLMLSIVKPKYFIPVHGEYRMLVKHAKLAQDLGVPSENIFITEIGNVIEFTTKEARIAESVPAGRTLIDGLGVGDVGNTVLKDRKQLSQDGILIVVVALNSEDRSILTGPDVVSRGFVYVRDSDEIINQVKAVIKETLLRCQEDEISQWSVLKSRIKESAGKLLYQKTGRRPMIIPIIQEIKVK